MTDTVARPETHLPTHCTPELYDELYRRSVEDGDAFWIDQARRLDWFEFPTKGGDWSYDPVSIDWFADGSLNLCHNAVDRHLDSRGDDAALVFEPDDPGDEPCTLTYRQLHREVVEMANALKSIGVGRGDRVTIYMPMIVRRGHRNARRVRGSARSIRLCSVAFRQRRWPGGSSIATAGLSSPPMKECAGRKPCRSKPMWMPRWRRTG